MAFSSVFFIFAFLPISLLLYYVVPKKFKNLMIVLVSLVFYSWGTPEYIVIMLFSIFFNYFAGLQISSCKESGGKAKLYLTITVVVNLLLLGFFKYYGFLIDNLNAVFHSSIPYSQLALPIGISFYTFTVLSYIFDIYYGKANVQKNVINFAAYVSFFPKVISGPIVQYNAMEDQLCERKLNFLKFGEGAKLFIIGLGKKVLIADCLNISFTAITALDTDTISILTAWLGVVLYTLVIYFDFSGYSDMAIGLGKMFGFDFDNNFDYPYISQSATEFWRRWHISLGRWFRDYVYIPMGGNRNGTLNNIRNICVVWLLTGFWHGSAWNFIFWGGFYGALLLLEKFPLKNLLPKIPSAIKHIVTMLLVMIGWVFFFSPNLSFAFTWLGKMFGIGAAGFANSTTGYYLFQNIILIICGVVGSTPIIANTAKNFIASNNRFRVPVSIICCGAILIFSIAYMLNSTYSTFLYFKF